MLQQIGVHDTNKRMKVLSESLLADSCTPGKSFSCKDYRAVAPPFSFGSATT